MQEKSFILIVFVVLVIISAIVLIMADDKGGYKIKKGYYIDDRYPYKTQYFSGTTINDECKKLCDSDKNCEAYRVYHDKMYKDKREYVCFLHSEVKEDDIKVWPRKDDEIQVSIKNK